MRRMRIKVALAGSGERVVQYRERVWGGRAVRRVREREREHMTRDSSQSLSLNPVRFCPLAFTSITSPTSTAKCSPKSLCSSVKDQLVSADKTYFRAPICSARGRMADNPGD